MRGFVTSILFLFAWLLGFAAHAETFNFQGYVGKSPVTASFNVRTQQDKVHNSFVGTYVFRNNQEPFTVKGTCWMERVDGLGICSIFKGKITDKHGKYCGTLYIRSSSDEALDTGQEIYRGTIINGAGKKFKVTWYYTDGSGY